MKRKIISLALIFTLLLSVFPINIFAQESVKEKKYDIKYVEKKNLTKIEIKKPTKNQIKVVGTELEYYRQIILEEIDENYPEFDPNIAYEGFMKEYYESYQDVINYINNATKFSSLVSDVSDFLIVLNDELNEKLMIMQQFLAMKDDYDKTKTSDENFSNFKNISLEQLTVYFSCKNGELHNDYYQSVLNGTKNKLYKNVKNSQLYKELAEANAELTIFLNYNMFPDDEIEIVYSDFDEYVCDYYFPYSSEENYFFSEETLYMFKTLGITPIIKQDYNFYSEKTVYNKDETNVIKKTFNRYLYVYVQIQLKQEGLYTKEVENIYNSTISKVNKSISVEEAYYECMQSVENIEQITGSNYKNIQIKKFSQIENGISDLICKYENSNLYSEDNLDKIFSILYPVFDFLDIYNIKDAEIPDDLLERVQNLIDEVPTKADELRMAKEKYIKSLNSFKNNIKYNQTKVVPIVNEGIKLINNATTIEKARSIYITYYNKAKTTIKKFNIKTSKVGNGYITSSKVAKYGSSVSISIKPKTGYKISKLYVDGKLVKTKTKYTFKNITKNHTIKAVFVKK